MISSGVLIGLIVTIVVIALGWVGIPLLKRKGWFNQDNATTTREILQIAKLILANVDIGKQNRDKTLLVLQIADIAVRYVEQVYTNDDNKVKKALAKNSVIETLKAMNISVNSEIEQLIELGVESAVNALPKTYK